jgi:hypothetical protein
MTTVGISLMSSLRTTWRSAAFLFSSFSSTKSSGSSVKDMDFFSQNDIMGA